MRGGGGCSSLILALHKELEQIEFPVGLTITINNTADAESGTLYEEENLIELSLAHCYSLADVVRELTRLMVVSRNDETEDEQ